MWLISCVFEALTESLMRRGDMSIILRTRGKCLAWRGSSKDLRLNTLYHGINTVYDKCVNGAEMGVKHQGVTYCFPDFGHSWDMYRRLSTSLISPPILICSTFFLSLTPIPHLNKLCFLFIPTIRVLKLILFATHENNCRT